MKYILFLGIICSGFIIHGQYAKAFVNKGVVKINGKFEFREGSSFDVRPNQKVNLNANTIPCMRDQKVCSFSGSQTVTYSQVMSTLIKARQNLQVISKICFQEITSQKIRFWWCWET